MEVIKTDCGLCINCCGVNAYVENGKLVKVEGTKENPISKGRLCPKGDRLMDMLYSPSRLKYPMKKVNGHFQRISWDDAIGEIATKLQQLKDKYGAHTLATWTGSVGVEHFEMAAFNQRFKGAFGTPNFFNPEGMCFRTRILARQITFGRYPVEEPVNANCILLWGRNPDESYPPVGRIVRERVEAGAKLVTIDPRRIPISRLGIYLQPRPGTDGAIALAMMNVIIEEHLWDKEFVEKYTFGFDKLAEHVREFTPEKAEMISSVPASEIVRTARIFATTKSACILEGVGHMNQFANGLQTNRAYSILMAITGNVDVPGGWVTCPQVRLADLRLPQEENNLGWDEFPVFHQFSKRPPPYGSAGLMTEVMKTEKPYPIKAFISSGSNPLLTFPDTKLFLEGIKNLELFVNIDPNMTETGYLADYVLPACTFLEETGIGGFPYGISYCEPYVMLRKKVVEPLYESKPIWLIWTELGRKMGYAEHFPWNTDEEVAEHFFSTSGVTMKDLTDHPAGVYFGKKEYRLFEKVPFATTSGKIELFSSRMVELGHSGLPVHMEPHQSAVANPEIVKEYPEILLTGNRQVEYINAQMHDVTALRARIPDAEVEVNPITAAKYGISHGELVGIETPRGSIRMKANVTQDIKPGVVSVPHGWAEANCNILLDAQLKDPVSGYITMNSNACRLVKLRI
ncbi:MAG TPA: molybdopterin-dependent oxidoreductase [Syntrophorhabdus sp.]|jgi:anaerobic selenocysteine-containing dehydrogenase|nr:molybdopterin-dependent oxidoreductase [Syntrophorhabdus sp.]MDI9559204.1 molybdopterin-dependent oxidoreductase [Pseudomonadota bacterium]OPX97075.1 MAG: Acetylene hydratase [Syntrophorhabdus sp. PtaB.Bin027]OQB76979.1 MAG: Acetylene hydratase [Deltaproteobacteria bacterium ADurb.Bin135]MBP8743593.1 molybdopterin-dependent oxidoreductase [Syntrophorhabdus sp.]